MEKNIVSYVLTVNWTSLSGTQKSASLDGFVDMGTKKQLDHTGLLFASKEMQTVAAKLFEACEQGNIMFDCVDATLIETNLETDGFQDFDAFKSHMMVKHNYCFDVHMDR